MQHTLAVVKLSSFCTQ